MLCSSEEMNSYNHMDFKLLRQSLLHNTAGCLILILHYIFSSIFNYSHAAIVVHENIMSPLFVCSFFLPEHTASKKKKKMEKKKLHITVTSTKVLVGWSKCLLQPTFSRFGELLQIFFLQLYPEADSLAKVQPLQRAICQVCRNGIICHFTPRH